MKTRLRIVLVVLASFSGAETQALAKPKGNAAGDAGTIRNSVFKINVVSQDPDARSPWLHKSISSSSGTGFYIGNNLIVTNAHVIDHARFVTVQRRGDPRAVTAVVKYAAHDADLALLTVPQDDYFANIKPLSFGPLPSLHSPVSAIGYPIGGAKLSITEGVVSRIDSRVYVHSGYQEHLLIQVDSAINPGNSGGPVVQGGRVIGVAFQSMSGAQSTGYVIPALIVERFLRDVDDGRYDGHPELGLRIQPRALLNHASAMFHGLPQGTSGVLVSNVAPYGGASGLLKPEDILVAIDGKKIDFDGRVVISGERVAFDTIYDLKQIGETVTFDILRNGIRLRTLIPAKTRGKTYSPAWSHEDQFPYVVYGGLVFSVLSPDYLRANWGNDWLQKAPFSLRYIHSTRDSERFVLEREEIVVVAGRLPHSVNEYARNRTGSVATTVNGKTFQSLRQFASLLSEAEEDIVTIGFDGDIEPVALDRALSVAARDEINDLYQMADDHWLPSSISPRVVASQEDPF